MLSADGKEYHTIEPRIDAIFHLINEVDPGHKNIECGTRIERRLKAKASSDADEQERQEGETTHCHRCPFEHENIDAAEDAGPNDEERGYAAVPSGLSLA